MIPFALSLPWPPFNPGRVEKSTKAATRDGTRAGGENAVCCGRWGSAGMAWRGKVPLGLCSYGSLSYRSPRPRSTRCSSHMSQSHQGDAAPLLLKKPLSPWPFVRRAHVSLKHSRTGRKRCSREEKAQRHAIDRKSRRLGIRESGSEARRRRRPWRPTQMPVVCYRGDMGRVSITAQEGIGRSLAPWRSSRRYVVRRPSCSLDKVSQVYLSALVASWTSTLGRRINNGSGDRAKPVIAEKGI